jgi:hypothetical protein
VKIDLARLIALLQLERTKNPAQVLQESLSRATENPQVAVQTVAAVAKQAREDGLKTSPAALIQANKQLQDLSQANPNIQAVAWFARLELVNYRTALNEGDTIGPKAASPVFKFPGVFMNGGHLIGIGQQKLDGAYWRNFVFEKTTIIYNGGPMALENVIFINCTFQMNQTPQTDKLSNTLLADNHITQLF